MGNFYKRLFHSAEKPSQEYSDAPLDSPADLPKDLEESAQKNTELLKRKMNDTGDFVDRQLTVSGFRVDFILIEGMFDGLLLTQALLDRISRVKLPAGASAQELYDTLLNEMGLVGDVKETQNSDDVLNFIMSGFSAILVDGKPSAIIGGVQGFKFRSISEPDSEVNLRGSKESFTEPIKINLTMIRRHLKSPNLKFENFMLGRDSHTLCSLVYLTDRTSPKILKALRKRLRSVNLDMVLASGYLQVFLEDKPLSVFSSVGRTERPDVLCAKINEGRVAVLVDGSPFALIVPYLFTENFQTLDDYCMNPVYVSFLRIVKYIAFFLAILLPGLYVAISNFHPELFPHALLFNVASAQETTPFPLMIEALIINLIYEIMQEAGLRLPRPIGHAVGIVGALVIGESAVTAGIIGAPMVMVVALTAVSGFVVPSLHETISFFKFAFILIGGISGLYGIALGLLFIALNTASINTYGVVYTSPVSPLDLKGMEDVFVRLNWRILTRNKMRVQNLNGSEPNEDNDSEKA